MKNEFVYGDGNLLKKIKAGKSVFLPEFYRNGEGEWVEKQVEIKTEAEFNSYVSRNKYIQDFLREQKSTVASKIYAKAFYVLTSPANTTIAGNLLSGKEFNSSKVYRAGNIPQAKDAIYGVMNTFTKNALGIIGYDVELPKVKKTNTQILKLLKEQTEGYFVPQINKDGLVVTSGLGRDHFDCNFVAVSAEDVTEEQLREYLKAPFGDHADENVGTVHAGAAEACAEEVTQVDDHVLQAVTAQNAVERHDEEGGQRAHPADPAELLGQSLIRGDNALAGLAAQSQLGHHGDEADEDCQCEVNEQECETAVCTHLIGEAPDVTETDSRTDGCHQESECGSPSCSLIFHKFPPAKLSPGYGRQRLVQKHFAEHFCTLTL